MDEGVVLALVVSGVCVGAAVVVGGLLALDRLTLCFFRTLREEVREVAEEARKKDEHERGTTERWIVEITALRFAWALFGLSIILLLVGGVYFLRDVIAFLYAIPFIGAISITLCIIARRRSLYWPKYESAVLKSNVAWRVVLLVYAGFIVPLRLWDVSWIVEKIGEQNAPLAEMLSRIGYGNDEWTIQTIGLLVSSCGLALYIVSIYVAVIAAEK